MAFPLWHPERFQGSRKTRRYFEGWYFKHVSADLGESWSFIPGISRGERRGEGYSFVQVIEGNEGRTWWFQYPLEAFRASSQDLAIEVGDNRFDWSGARIRLDDGSSSFSADLSYSGCLRLPTRLLSPGVMGPYSFVPFMECRHGLVSLDHRISGRLLANGRSISFEAGRGYAEKDWGSSMPRSWIWTQSNNFPSQGDSFMLSVARIPWLGSSFTGFLCVGSLGGRLLLEATYTGARLRDVRVGDKSVGAVLERGSERIEVEVQRSRGGILRAPVNGLLSRRIAESVDAVLRVEWRSGGHLVFEGEARKSGLEVVGEAASLGMVVESGLGLGFAPEALPGAASDA
jgi:hypothetical protein